MMPGVFLARGSLKRLGGGLPPTRNQNKRGNGDNTHDSNDCEHIPRRRDDVRGTDGHLRFVARHGFRVVRLLYLRHARAHSSGDILLRRQSDGGVHLHAARFRCRFRGAPLRCAVLWTPRRHHRPQIHLPHHDDADGRRHLLHRPAAVLRFGRHHRADHPDRPASGARSRARRRIRRRGDLRRRTRSEEQTWPVYVVDSNHGHARSVHGPAARARNPHHPGRTDLRRLGLAHSVPALGDPARSVDLDPAQVARVAGVRPHERTR